MKLKRLSIPALHSVQRLSAPRFRPRLVFARDDSLGAGKTPASSRRIMIVEDDFLVASEMENALAEAGFEVAGVAGSADEAVRMAAAESPALVVMDIRLSGLRDGIDAALELFASQGVRCVFATAHQTADARTRAEPARPLAWVPKPYTMPALVEVVRQALRELQSRTN